MHVYGYKGRGGEGNQSVHGKEALGFLPAKPIDTDICISAPQHIQPKKIIIAI